MQHLLWVNSQLSGSWELLFPMTSAVSLPHSASQGLVGHQEGGVETHTELADQADVCITWRYGLLRNQGHGILTHRWEILVRVCVCVCMCLCLYICMHAYVCVCHVCSMQMYVM